MTSPKSAGEPSTLPPPAELESMEVRDATGASMGHVQDIHVDRAGGETRYLALDAEAPGEVHLLPVAIVRVEGDGGGGSCLMAACTSERLRGASTVAREEGISLPDEARVDAYFRDLHGAGYMRPENEPPEVHGAGYMRPENEPPEVHGAGYMRPENEPPEVHGAGRMDPKFLSTVRTWREG